MIGRPTFSLAVFTAIILNFAGAVEPADTDVEVLSLISRATDVVEIYSDRRQIERVPSIDPEDPLAQTLRPTDIVRVARTYCETLKLHTTARLDVISVAIVKGIYFGRVVWHYEVQFVPQVFKAGGRPIYRVPVFGDGSTPPSRIREPQRVSPSPHNSK